MVKRGSALHPQNLGTFLSYLTIKLTCSRENYHLTLKQDKALLERKKAYSVYPFVCLSCRPDENKIFYSGSNREILWNDKKSGTRFSGDEFGEMSRHCFPVMRNEDPPLFWSHRQNFFITQAGQTCRNAVWKSIAGSYRSVARRII